MFRENVEQFGNGMVMRGADGFHKVVSQVARDNPLTSGDERPDRAAIELILDAELTDGHVVTVDIVLPEGRLTVMANVAVVGKALYVYGLHAQSVSFSAYAIAPAGCEVGPPRARGAGL